MLLKIWKETNLLGRAGLVVGAFVIAGVTAGLAYRTLKPSYEVLFSDLAPQDAAAMVAELEKAKAAYRLDQDGATILVPRDDVYKMRMKLMSHELPLHGAVGFELFNNSDFGITEFAQKINFQRALQGELARTIHSLEAVQSARVHLALAEKSLFKDGTSNSKASVTVATKPGFVLTADQIVGIQRLVAASVPETAVADVTILNQRGIAISRNDALDESVGSSTQLEQKKNYEEYFVRKATSVLDRALEPGAAIATVDVVLNLDRDQVTTEEVLAARSDSGEGPPLGVVVREKLNYRGGSSSTETSLMGASTRADLPSGTTSAETEYQTGRRIQKVVVASGAVKRLSVAVVVREALDDAKLERLGELVALAVGLNKQRGDAIVVRSMARPTAVAKGPEKAVLSGPVAAVAPARPPALASEVSPDLPTTNSGDFRWEFIVALLTLLVLSRVLLLRYHQKPPAQLASGPNLSEQQREELVGTIQGWLRSSDPAKARV